MIVVCDTSPICYLILIDKIDLLPRLFGEVFIPQTVQNELISEGNLVQNYLLQPPDWLKIKQVIYQGNDPELEKLDLGEREAILLAKNLKAELIVLDDLNGRRIAANQGLKVVGLLAILYEAGIKDLIDFPLVIEQLKKTNFRASENLITQFLDRYYKQKSSNN